MTFLTYWEKTVNLYFLPSKNIFQQQGKNTDIFRQIKTEKVCPQQDDTIRNSNLLNIFCLYMKGNEIEMEGLKYKN